MPIRCVYAFINGAEGIREGGNAMDAGGVMGFAVVTRLFCLALGLYEMAVGRPVKSLLLKNDGKTWLMDAILSLVTFLGSAVRSFLDEP